MVHLTSDRYAQGQRMSVLHCCTLKECALTMRACLHCQVPELPVYGVAIPTVSGMRLVLDELGAAQGNNRYVNKTVWLPCC